MKRSWIGVMLAVSSLCELFAPRAVSHPAAGIVVTAKGELFFIHTGQGVCKIDADGKLTYIHRVKGGGHFLALDPGGEFSTQLPRLFEKLAIGPTKPTLLYASGGAPFVVARDGNLYYGSGYPDGEDMAPGFHTLTRLSPDGKRTLFAPDLKKTLVDLNEGVMGLTAGRDGSLFVACPNAIVKVKLDGTVTTLAHPVDVPDLASACFSFSLSERYRRHRRRNALRGCQRLSLCREDYDRGQSRNCVESREALVADGSGRSAKGRVRAGIYKSG